MVDFDRLTPYEQGRVDFGRRIAISECRYDEAENAREWLRGWERANERTIQRRNINVDRTICGRT